MVSSSSVCHQKYFLNLSIIKIGITFQTLNLFNLFYGVRRFAETKYGHRLTAHPGPFNVLVSPNENVVQNTITDLTIHVDIMDFMGLSRTPYNKLNIQCNGVYGDKQSAMDRFCKNFELLPENVQSRLT